MSKIAKMETDCVNARPESIIREIKFVAFPDMTRRSISERSEDGSYTVYVNALFSWEQKPIPSKFLRFVRIFYRIRISKTCPRFFRYPLPAHVVSRQSGHF